MPMFGTKAKPLGAKVFNAAQKKNAVEQLQELLHALPAHPNRLRERPSINTELEWQNSEGLTPLCLAAQRGDHAATKLLLTKGANACHATARQGGGAPLHFAVASGSAQTVGVLLEHGCDPFRDNAQGQTAYDLALARGVTPVTQLIEKACKVAAYVRVRMACHNHQPDGGFQEKWVTLIRREQNSGERNCQLYIFRDYADRRHPARIWVNGSTAEPVPNDPCGTFNVSIVPQGDELHFAMTGYGTFAQIQRSTHPGHDTSVGVLASMLNRYAQMAHEHAMAQRAPSAHAHHAQPQHLDANSACQRQDSGISHPSQFGAGGTGQSHFASTGTGGSGRHADARQGSHSAMGANGVGPSGSANSDMRSAQTPYDNHMPPLQHHTGSSGGGDAPPHVPYPQEVPRLASADTRHGHTPSMPGRSQYARAGAAGGPGWHDQPADARFPPQRNSSGTDGGWHMHNTGGSSQGRSSLEDPARRQVPGPQDDGSGNYPGHHGTGGSEPGVPQGAAHAACGGVHQRSWDSTGSSYASTGGLKAPRGAVAPPQAPPR